MTQSRFSNSIFGGAARRHKYRAEIKRYVALLLIPPLLLVVLYLNVNQVISQQTEDYAQLMVEHFYAESYAMMNETRLVSNAILRDTEVSWALEQEDPTSLNALHVCKILSDCLAQSPFVQHAYLICEKSGKIFSEGGLFAAGSLSAILSRVGIPASALDAPPSESSVHILNESRLAPYCVIPIYDEDGGDTFRGYLIVTLRMTEFLRMMYELDADICTIFNDDVYISSYLTNIKIEDFDWRDEAAVSALAGTPQTCVYLDEGNYTYLVAVSKDTYNRPLHVILKWFFIYAATALVVGFVYLYYISKKRYQRISAMIAALPASYQGDQSYEQVYDSIRSSLEDYRTQREQLAAGVQEHMLYQLLTADGKQRFPSEQLQNVGLPPDSPFYYVVSFFVTEIADPALAGGHAGGTAEFLRILFRSTIGELAARAQVPYAFCEDHRVNIAVLCGEDASALRGAVLELTGNTIEILINSYNITVQATISSPVSSLPALADAYQETHRLHSFARSINSSAAFISQEDLQHGSGTLLNGDFIRQEQILINTILARKYDAVPSMVESILSTHVSPLRKNYELAHRRLDSISTVLAEGVRMAPLPSASAEESAATIAQADSVRNLTAAAENAYGLMAKQSRESTSESDIVDIACSYIDQNLSDRNLNVTVICEAAGVSVQRLTRMFQSQFNMAVAEYMNACRIKRAKELLPDKQLTVAQIALQVGYSNTDTFTRNFKKIEGITATEYRKTLCGG